MHQYLDPDIIYGTYVHVVQRSCVRMIVRASTSKATQACATT